MKAPSVVYCYKDLTSKRRTLDDYTFKKGQYYKAHVNPKKYAIYYDNPIYDSGIVFENDKIFEEHFYTKQQLRKEKLKAIYSSLYR